MCIRDRDLGVDRLLTGGFANKAPMGIDTISELVELGGEHISIMPGSGINASNIIEILQKTGTREFHLSGKKSIDSQMLYRKMDISMGSASGDDEYQLEQADFDTINALKNVLNDYEEHK